MPRPKNPPKPILNCLTCGDEFRQNRAWQRFCSKKCREDIRKVMKPSEFACTYCGLLSDTVDHVPPRSVRPRLLDLGMAGKLEFVTVRCCRECNSLLGARPPWTVELRRQRIHEILRKRYRKVLAMPEWSDEELEEMGYVLRTEIHEGLALQAVTRVRVAWTGPYFKMKG